MTGTAVAETIQQEKTPLVTMQGVDVINDGNLILSNVDITINKGEFVYLLGKVGSGKSSIIKTLIAELPVKKGAAEVAGFKLLKIKKRHIPYLRRKLGVVFQDFQLLMDRTVQDNLLFVMEATGWKRKREMLTRATEVLILVGLQDKAFKMPHQLSGGEQQRVAIARALLNNPQVILADEPTGNLDEDTATEIMNLLHSIHQKQQTAVLMVTHNRELYKRYPGRVLICENGGVREMEQEIEFSLEDLQPGTTPVTPAEEDFVLEAAAPAVVADVAPAAPAADADAAPAAEALVSDEVAAQDTVPVAASVAVPAADEVAAVEAAVAAEALVSDEVAAQDAVPVAATVADEPVAASVVAPAPEAAVVAEVPDVAPVAAPIEGDEFFEIEGDPSKVEEK